MKQTIFGVAASVACSLVHAVNVDLQKVQIAQTHLMPLHPTKTWVSTSDTLDLHPTANRDALVVVQMNVQGGRNPRLQISDQQGWLGSIALTQNLTKIAVEDQMVAYPDAAALWYGKIPAKWMKSGMIVRVTADQVDGSRWTRLPVGAPIDFTLYSLPFYLFGATDQTLAFDQVKQPPLDAQREAWAKWPISRLMAQNHPMGRVDWPYMMIGPRNGQAAYKVQYPADQKDGFAVMSAVLNAMGQIRQANGDGGTANQYYAPLVQVNAAGAFVGTGGGLGGGHIGTGDHLYKGIFIHEQGHAFGLPHAGESYAANNGGYPYIGGSVKGSLWGFDQNKQTFLTTLVPTSASSYSRCATQTFAGYPRQLNSRGLCFKQDPMQSGSGDQAAGFLYTMFSDYNVAKMQRYFEGKTSLSSTGVKQYQGGRIFKNSSFATGYARWDSLDKTWVSFDPSVDGNKGLYGAKQNFPISNNIPVYTVVLSISKAGTAGATQIYPVLGPYTGQLIQTFDPNVTQDLQAITPNVSTYPWYCRNSGCDYTLRVHYSNGVIKDTVIQGGFRPWFGESSDFSASVLDPTNGGSYKVFALNVPALSAIERVELLDTPKVWLGMARAPVVLASR